MTNRAALVFGASGLVGTELVNLLLANADYNAVISYGRSPISAKHPKLKQVQGSFEDLDSNPDVFNVQDLYCCLGTTIKKAKTKEAFQKIDFEYVKKIASIASAKGVSSFAVVSSIGADKNSGNFYLKTKGEMEESLKKLSFERLIILQPSILLGERKEKRLGEKIGKLFIQILSPILLGKLKKYRGVQAKHVAQKMIDAILHKKPGTFVIPSDQINKSSIV